MFTRKSNRRTAARGNTGHNSALSRNCRFEMLEDRKLMAADVAFAVDSVAVEPATIDPTVDTLGSSVYEAAGYARRGCVHLDFGDAPDESVSDERYPTRLVDDGARHVPTGPTLGKLRDAEENGQPSVGATRDGVDEDGVALFPGVAVVQVSAGSEDKPLLSAWIDFNQDGDWDDAGEQIFADVPVADGTNVLTFDMPEGYSGATYARFRLSNQSGLETTGLARDGEVEDYRFGHSKRGVLLAAVNQEGGDSKEQDQSDAKLAFQPADKEVCRQHDASPASRAMPWSSADRNTLAKDNASYNDTVDELFAIGTDGRTGLGL